MEQTTGADQPKPVHTNALSPVFGKEGDGGFTTRSDDIWKSKIDHMAMEPVLIQPGLGITTTTITTITQTGGVLGSFLPCCLDLSLAHQYGECLCLPLLPGSTFAIRVGIRERYKIRGSVYEDWTTVCCCYPLAVCQMTREMKRRMKSQTYHVSTTLQCS
ncbi:PLAC8-like protein 1 isoform X2 [Lampris incognitus]|uniref:PLAC8-like protein 1 isoform X2 n=1 Tax=Lampris incognitus TaxID=2546036 RepID=UPI0024B5A635|nr:PLAC8-like protein 1 isoform X2 [Lampris incognitus]